MVTNEYISLSEVSNLTGKSKETLRRWDKEGILIAVREPISNYRIYRKQDILTLFPSLNSNPQKETNHNFVIPNHKYSVLELFAGAGGLAVGLEQAGLNCAVLNEIDKFACATLKKKQVIQEMDFLCFVLI